MTPTQNTTGFIPEFREHTRGGNPYRTRQSEDTSVPIVNPVNREQELSEARGEVVGNFMSCHVKRQCDTGSNPQNQGASNFSLNFIH